MNSSPEEALFALVLAKPVEKRAAFLDVMCEGDSALRQRLEALLVAHEQPDTLLATQSETARPTIKLDLPEPVRRKVALKVIKLGMDTREVIARFEAERQALAMMDHPNIAKVLDAGTTESSLTERASLLDCGSPLPLFPGSRRVSAPKNPKGILSSSPGLPSPRGYPWMRVVIRHNPNGVASILAPRTAATPLGLWSFSNRFPRVARASQPWALRRNPFGIQPAGSATP